MSRPGIERYDELPTTMERARELAEAGAPAATTVVAAYQSAGRGTRGRTWSAPPGSCLMFTTIARPDLTPAALAELPLLVSGAICEYLNHHLGLACEVKPPNDIVVGDRKLCGVLCTSKIVGERVEYALFGIGLNTQMTTEQLPLDRATSIAIELGFCPPHDELLDGLLEALERLSLPVAREIDALDDGDVAARTAAGRRNGEQGDAHMRVPRPRR